MKRCELQPIFTELRLFKDFAALSQGIATAVSLFVNRGTAMLSKENS